MYLAIANYKVITAVLLFIDAEPMILNILNI